ncbi:hypothetical protein BP6252_10000 [Coleophoma cylindrospora]|uniref:Heterokaryon incompatibility domain-containing protein n=1 Tax=Coleophoma cylindrospora TaxID=1849047 RepID=A0A3D8QX78_9HELO|nr:hypothetical protein BP6252_10000 [Coleophoma cylindrospora]
MSQKFPITPRQWYDFLASLGGGEDSDCVPNIPLDPHLHLLKKQGILDYLIPEYFEDGVDKFIRLEHARENSIASCDILMGIASLVAFWLRECFTLHPSCQATITIWPDLPRRVVDLEQFEFPLPPYNNSSQVRIVDGRERRGAYAALSYRWPENPVHPTILTSENEPQLMRSISPELLLGVVQDACIFVSRLGIRYLWVDSLCIMQGPGGDWHLEADKMDTIYSDAIITIAAVDGTRLISACKKRPFLSREVAPIRRRSTDDSLQTENFTKDSKAETQHVQVVEGKGTSLTPEAIWSALSSTGNFPSRPPGALDERGWTFQEQLLSRRLVSITSNGIFWDCLHNSACDRRPTGFLGDFSPKFRDTDDRAFKRLLFDSSMPLNYQTPADWYWLWRRGVQDYTNRGLSNMSDRMIALNGIAKRMSVRLADEYVLGIWRNDLLRSLIWFVEHQDTKKSSLSDHGFEFPLTGPRVPRVESSRPKSFVKDAIPVVAPSWSWVSTTLPIQYRLWHPFERYIRRKTEYVSNLAQVHHIYASRLDHYKFDVFHGSLTIGGPSTEAFLFDGAIFVCQATYLNPKVLLPESQVDNPPTAHLTSYMGRIRHRFASEVSILTQWANWIPRSNLQMARELPPVTQVQPTVEIQPAPQASVLEADRSKDYDERAFVESPFLADRLELLKQSKTKVLKVTCLAVLEGGYTNSLKARYYLVLQKSKSHAEEFQSGERHRSGLKPGPASGEIPQHGPDDFQDYQRIGICAFDTVQCTVLPEHWLTVNIL